MTYEEELTRSRKCFERDTAEHEMTILRDDGLYRHLRFAASGTYIYGFDLVTWPGYLAIVGDCGDFVFSRLRDMFSFFESDGPSINPDYWAQKLQAPRYDAAYRYSYEAFRERVLGWFADVAEESEAADLRAALERDLLADYLGAVDSEHEARRLLHDFEHEGLRIVDSWEWTFRQFDERFLWCCWAIAWGVRQYRRASAPAEAAA